MTEETLVNTLALIGAGTVAWAIVRVLAAIAAWAQRMPEADAKRAALAAKGGQAAASPAPTALDPAAPEDLPRAHVAAIAAAICAMHDSHRVLVIEDPHTGFAWSAEGRWQHQTSHKPH